MMKVLISIENYNKDWIFYKKGDIKDIRVIETFFCCNKMEKAWKDRFIYFGEYDEISLNKNRDVNIYRCYAYPEGAVWDECKIDRCPFCGERISISIKV